MISNISRLVDLGYALLPLKPGEKEPHFALIRELYGNPKWKPFLEKPASEDEVTQWLKHSSDCNIGIITGRASGNLMVLDIDDPLRMPKAKLPRTVTATTGRGIHLYYYSDRELKTCDLCHNGKNYGQLKSQGSYVVAPPSTHPGGWSYQWLTSPFEIEPTFLSSHYIYEFILPAATVSGKHKEGECLSTHMGTKYYLDYLDTCFGKELAYSLLRSEEFVLAVSAACEIEIAQVEDKFTCPYHSGEKVPSANFTYRGDGGYLMRDWHNGRWVRIAQLYHDYVGGLLFNGRQLKRELSKVESALWLIRLAAKLGFIELHDIVPHPVPWTQLCGSCCRLHFPFVVGLPRLARA